MALNKHRTWLVAFLTWSCFATRAASDLTAGRQPVVYVCDRTNELHVIWQAANHNSTVGGTRACVYKNFVSENLEILDLTLLSATETEIFVPDRRIHQVFRIPSQKFECNCNYKLKVESIKQDDGSATACRPSTAALECPVEIGSGLLCPACYKIISWPTECVKPLGSLSFLRDQCHAAGKTASPPVVVGGSANPAAIAVPSVVCSAALLAAVFLSVRCYRIRRSRSNCRHVEAEALTTSVFGLLNSNPSKLRMFILLRRSSGPLAMVPSGVTDCSHLLGHPCSKALISVLVEQPAVPEVPHDHDQQQRLSI